MILPEVILIPLFVKHGTYPDITQQEIAVISKEGEKDHYDGRVEATQKHWLKKQAEETQICFLNG